MASEGSSQSPKTERTPGSIILPLARVKRIIKEDKDVAMVNPEATYCVAYATELFMEYLVKEGYMRARQDKRKTVFYKDLASAVSEIEQFEFLEDVIPPTMTLKSALERRNDALNEDDPSLIERSPKRARTSNNDESMSTQSQEYQETTSDNQHQYSEHETNGDPVSQVNGPNH